MSAQITVGARIRADEVAALDRYAATFPAPYTGNRSAAVRELLRAGMEAAGIEPEVEELEEEPTGAVLPFRREARP